MAGLFPLGGGRGSSNQQYNNQGSEIPHAETWYSKNDDASSYRGLELWNQHQQQQHHYHHHHHVMHPHARPLLQRDLYSSGVGPSRGVSDDQSSSRSALAAMRAAEGGISCQDCGNQAKKDCPHMRCRTCCKSRGYECQTHVKSTWVPASKRRERQQQLAALQEQQQRDISKRPRDPTACTARLPSSGLEEGHFPAVVSSPAEFRCVKVSCLEEADDRYAYQTAVKIGGHMFKGILYDYGPENSNNNSGNNNYMTGETSAGVGGSQPLNFSVSGAVASSSAALVDPSSLYQAPHNTFMSASGTQFFPHTRS
ncbi:protein SHI RELATED SEQUENCE 1 [Cajanus cajan]|uniref:Uncharacterized protein n=1 Tax=Cajanus cajan TaxID=3821 RepID=A0A151QVN5_CAJCA|nr:protein SHI RELATED SEQUENCE 1 [Cajanus cajan]XP_020207134.1 protein SHI RELATED SEQUENCE 1 [Cajanus cajan]XP_029125912.1 protein SHI RELATED SEQUENCE 1 [Cajanus cajan]KYP34336.1 hypothetical protein KK1_044727 [Cajanus cajan]